MFLIYRSADSAGGGARRLAPAAAAAAAVSYPADAAVDDASDNQHGRGKNRRLTLSF